MEERKVSNFELFYDLIFAYAISKMTQSLTYGIEKVSFLEVSKFLMMMLVFWTVWTYQTVFINRFQRSITDYIFLLFDMFWVIILANSINNDFEKTMVTFCGSTSILFLSISIQYLIVYLQRDKNDEQRNVAKMFSIILFIVSLIGFFSFTVVGNNFYLQFPIYAASIFIAGFIPLFSHKTLKKFPVAFSHLAERYSLFVILLFGEGIIAVALTTNINHITVENVLFFLIVVMSFVIYIFVFENLLNHHLKTAGLVMMHVHLFIFIAIEMLITTMELLTHHQLHDHAIITMLVGSFLVLFVGSIIWLQLAYFKKQRLNQLQIIFLSITVLVTTILEFVANNTVGNQLILLVGLIVIFYIFSRTNASKVEKTV